MLTEATYEILTNAPIARNVLKLELSGDTAMFTAPGQFADIAVDGFYLRRPISVCDWEPGKLTLIYKVVGGGTEKLAAMGAGESLSMLSGLGNGFDADAGNKNPLLVGGGVGTPPLYGLAKRLVARGKRPAAVLGFASERDVFYKEAFEALGVPVTVCTVDGSAGIHGFVTDGIRALESGRDYVYACGPEPMLKAVYDACDTDGQFSFEERMACGFGACMGCSCKTKYGYKRICRDGPVLKKEEIVW